MSEQDSYAPPPSELPKQQITEASSRPLDQHMPVERSSPHSLLRWAFGLVIPPLLFFAAGVGLLGILGIAQRAGWIGTPGGTNNSRPSEASVAVDYICPMMCTPPQQEPGRCPVCAMELVPAATGAGGDERSIVVDSASRRIANIQTVAARSVPLRRTIRAIGKVRYDERSLKTIAAYTPGRYDELHVDYTGALVKKGDLLAVFYSPELYSAQVEFLQTSRTLQESRPTRLTVVSEANQNLLVNSRKRLVQLGMSEQQIAELERSGEARSRIEILAPMSGTVIEKLITEGEYVKEGQSAFRLADLSTVWVMLELLPEDAAHVRSGQLVEVSVQSLPGRTFSGHVTFIDPELDPAARTVGVRVAMPNPEGLLRIGDYVRATIAATTEDALQTPAENVVVVPRNAVLMAAQHSVVYVESEPGRFEIRSVVTGPTNGSEIAVLSGLTEGEVVATRGNFLIDSQMQLAGNPSLIDPIRVSAPVDRLPGMTPAMLAEIDKLPADDREMARQQALCPVTDLALGSMGVPARVVVEGTTVFLCCEGCRASLVENPSQYLPRINNKHDHETGRDNTSGMDLPPIAPIEELEIDPDDQHTDGSHSVKSAGAQESVR